MAIPLFDAHCDTLSRLLAEPEQHLLGNGGQWDLSRTGGLAPQAQIFAAFADSALPGAVEQAARQIEAAVGLPAYEDYFAKLADFGCYLQGGYYAFGLGLRQELIRQMLG